ncbi:permease [Photorhabdus khanii]|uniref:permease n=1 Tax=Photorhabdus khanii TaxID=1004150 RepID=UPI003743F319
MWHWLLLQFGGLGSYFLFTKAFGLLWFFGGGIAYFQWQVALAVGALFGMTWLVRSARSAYKEAPPTRRKKKHAGGFQDSYDFDQKYHIGTGDE